MGDRLRTLTGGAAAVVLGLALLTGCGDDEPDAETTGAGAAAGSTTEATATSDGVTGTTAGDDTTDEEPAADDPTDDITDGTTGDDAPEDDAAGDGVPADEDAADVSWTLNAFEFRGQDGRRVAFDCPAGGEPSIVWGSDPYTDDSSVCTAAVHSELITLADGGRVVIEITPGEESYTGTEAGGVTTNDYGSWSGSFTFPSA